jgi:hypothetical protein
MNFKSPLLVTSVLCCLAIAQQPQQAAKKTAPQPQGNQVQQTAQPSGQNSSEVTITRAVVCLNVNEREPEEPGNVFPPEVKRLYCFTEIKSSGEPLEIQHRWYWKDELLSAVPLSVKSARFRTYSAKSIPAYAAGDWRVAIVNSRNEETLQIINFEIK